MFTKDQYAIIVLAIVIALVMGFAIGTVTEIGQDGTEHEIEDEHAHSTTLPHEHDMMNHGMHEVSAEGAPSVDLIVHTDPKSGWNLQISTTNFEFSPEDVSLNHTDGEGHAHLYIDGVKITRIYDEWFHIPEIESGMHTVKVTLNTNDHNEYAINGSVIQDSERIMVK